jgi:lipopolysaccharide export system protein LptA
MHFRQNNTSQKLLLVFLQSCLFMLISPLLTRAQVTPAPITDSTAADSMRTIEIVQGDNWIQASKDTITLQILTGNAVVRHENTFLSGDSIVCDLRSGIAEVFGHVHINDGDTVQTYSDYLKYLGKEKKAFLKKNVRFLDRKGSLYSNEVEYDVQSGIASYSGGGRVENGKTILTSGSAVYYSNTKDVYFKKNVKLKDPKYKINADSLLYNTESQTATFIAPTHIVSKDSSIIDTRSGSYDLKKGDAVFYNKTSYRDKTRSLSGKNIAYEEKTGIIQVEGNGKLVDSVNKLIVLGNQILINKKKGSFIATKKPVMIFYKDKDSTYVAADTLYSGTETDQKESKSTKKETGKKKNKNTEKAGPADSIRLFIAFHHVRIYNDSLQAVADSLYYSDKDSVFRLYRDPVCWNGKSQISGDTMLLFTKNRKPDQLQVMDNALMVNKTSQGFFNQAAGRTLHALFKKGELDSARIKGSPASCAYYVQDDDSAYVGLNSSTADAIDIFFSNKSLRKVKFINDVNGNLYPMQQIPEDKKQLSNFRWLEDRRPKSKLALFE